MAIRRETDSEKRRREVAESLDYAAKATRDLSLARRPVALSAQVASVGLDPDDEIRYEDVLGALRDFERS